MPLVSIVVPTYNRPEYLERALTSIENQTFQDFEVIIINDGGCKIDHMIENFNTLRIRLIVLKKRCGPGSRNRAFEIASGDYIAYLDDDDLYYPDHLEALVGGARSSKKEFVYSECLDVLEDTQGTVLEKNRRSYPPYHPSLIKRTTYIPVCSILHKKNLIDKAGMFDPALYFAEDWDLWFRFSRLTDFYHVKKITCEYRKRENTVDSLNSLLKAAETWQKFKVLLKSKHNITIELRKEYNNTIPPFVIDNLKKSIGDEKIYVYGAGSYFDQLYPYIKDNIAALIDTNHAQISDKIKTAYGLDVLPLEQFDAGNGAKILSTAVDRIADVLLTFDKYGKKVDSLIFLDDFFDEII